MSALDKLRERYQQVMLGRENTETLKAEALRQTDLGTQNDPNRAGNAAIYSQSPAGRHANRGVPILGAASSTQPHTDPLQALIDKQAGNRDRFGDPPPKEDA